ncbi:MAG: hypothetical protein WC455_19425 [Dehalococcoidia bacterium]|jgi:hypothetical protein
MAKREIKRQVEETEPVAATGQAEETQEPVQAALPAEKQVRPLNVTIEFKNFLGVRRVGQSIWFNDNRKMRKESIDISKPLKITFAQ